MSRGSGVRNTARGAARSNAINTVRIIGGVQRRQLIRFPDSLGLRPTPDRVRETLFNWLGQELDGLHCLDLFAGSGALGLEAASRGAERVVLVEAAAAVAHALRDNIEHLHVGNRVELVRGDALKFAASRNQPTAQRFDVVFLDPPYRQGWLDKLQPVLPLLLQESGCLYVEAEYPVTALGDWHTVKQGKAGQVYYHLLQRASLPTSETSTPSC